eukprot:CAMPEP_0167774104 /NCGR_PEP_ID=MMETSP0111_2-20121227/1809_1 /TAXON_ID=91324 /ORGANISM="Lotharella globosa, Strain CCCM811" /LENGTH=208 /DNA_ID=CAMNT_0007663853 /DNA_START=40 /DNA_END=666 /DNA_ORIENTATION=+
MSARTGQNETTEENFDVFRKQSGEFVRDISSYVKSWLNTNPSGEIHIGADSKSVNGIIVFAVAVCLYKEHCGGHVVYKKVKVPFQGSARDLVHVRLLEECSQALEVADTIDKSIEGEKPITVHIDCSPEAARLSHSVYNAGMGWIASAGFVAKAKPDAWAASSVANCIVNGNFHLHSTGEGGKENTNIPPHLQVKARKQTRKARFRSL